MNERFRELEKQSYKEIIETNDYNGSAYTVREFDSEKFAELIIQECAQVVDSKIDSDYGVANAWCEGEDLLKHFGVK